jgi:hypothetical protein
MIMSSQFIVVSVDDASERSGDRRHTNFDISQKQQQQQQ